MSPSVGSEKAYTLTILHIHATTAKREGAGWRTQAVWGGRTPPSGMEMSLPLYSITQVYLFPELHFGDASISNAVRPRIESEVTSVTPRTKGDPPQ